MVKMVAKTLKYTIDFTLAQALTLVAGDSGTGKTYLCSVIEMCKDVDTIRITSDRNLAYVVNVVTTLNDLNGLLHDGNPHIVFIDKFEQWETAERVAAEEIILENLRSCYDYNYFVIMYRGMNSLGYVEPKYILNFSNKTFRLLEGGAV